MEPTTPPASTSSPGAFAVRRGPRGKRGTAALTVVLLASIVTVSGAAALFAWFGFVQGPRSSWHEPINWSALVGLELVVAAPVALAFLVAGALASELSAEDEGYRRGRVGLILALVVGIGAPLLSMGATWLAHAGG